MKAAVDSDLTPDPLLLPRAPRRSHVGMKRTKVDEVRKGIRDVHSEKQEEEVHLT